MDSPGGAGRLADANESVASHVGLTLLVALILTLAVMILGVVVHSVKTGNNAAKIIPLDQLVRQYGRGNPSALLDTGILLLFAAPLAGVLVAWIDFVRYRNRQFALITAALVVILGASFVVGLR